MIDREKAIQALYSVQVEFLRAAVPLAAFAIICLMAYPTATMTSGSRAHVILTFFATATMITFIVAVLAMAVRAFLEPCDVEQGDVSSPLGRAAAEARARSAGQDGIVYSASHQGRHPLL